MPQHWHQRDNRSRLTLADEFIRQAQKIKCTAEFLHLIDAFANEIGFRHYALIHHYDLRQPSPGLIHLQNYPDVWADYFIEHRLYLHDPVVHACMRTNCSFSWRDLGQLISLTSRHKNILRGAAKEGLGEGLSVPAFVPGERPGSCSFAGPRRGIKVERYLGLVHVIGAFAFQAARRLVSNKRLVLPARPKLAPRQRECVILAGQGKTNWEIAKILGLSQSTINHYLNDARGRYDVTTRAQLVIGALLEGEVSFCELAPWQYDNMTE